MNIDKLKNNILQKMSQEEMDSKISQKIDEASGLIDEKGALMLVAQELNIEIPYEDDEDFDYTISDILEGQRDVEVTGRIVEISSIKEFTKKDGSTGKLASLRIADNSGAIRLTLWNDKADLVADLKKGNVIKIENAFARNWNNKMELNSGSELSIERLEEYDESKYPKIKENYNISELVENLPASIEATVKLAYPLKEFNKKDGSTGCLKSLILEDETGTIRATLWNELAKMEINTADKVKIDGFVKQGYSGLEISINTIEVTEKTDPNQAKKVDNYVSIEDLPHYDKELVSVKGKILNKSIVREVEFPDRVAKVQEIKVSDGTGSVRVVFWGNNITKLDDLDEGDEISLSNCKTKKYINRMTDLEVVDLTFTFASTIELIEKSKVEIKLNSVTDLVEKFNKNELDADDISFGAKVYSSYPTKEFNRYDGSKGMVKSVELSDGDNTVRMTLWDDNTNLEITEGDTLKILHAKIKENNGYYDINTNKYTNIEINPKDLNLVSIRTHIVDIKEESKVELQATVVDFRKQDLILNLCPNCKKRLSMVDSNSGIGICEACGEVTPNEVLTATVVLDDGTGTINGRIYEANISKLTGLSIDELKEKNIEALNLAIGNEYIFYGNVTMRNDDLELNIRGIQEFDINKEF
ncbi:replication factor A [Methanococcus voltae]|uniref:replication factor A n=1 Tax=Methanococcus voltae TaxID=2188 RepID=UPI001AE5A211|nr:replication factor A [Methanococcus voltae]MBP2172082.1 replication factor A1 [Methanococcus voltae]